jgi:cytochrome c-type biogenesis protein CcmH
MTAPENQAATPDPITALRQKLQQLKALHEEGTLGDEAYAAARTPLERELLDLVMAQPPGAAPAAVAAAAAARPAKPSKGLLAGVYGSVLVLAAVGYMVYGSPGLPSAGPPGSAVPAAEAPAMTPEQFVAAVDQLAARMAQEPANAEGWALLARSYVRMGRHADAVPAFAKAVEIVGADPSLLVDYADALAMANGRVLDGEPLVLVQRALRMDPDNAKGLALAGTGAFNNKDYTTAVQHWERLARVSPPDSPFLAQLQGSIDEARKLGGMPPGPRVAPEAQAAPAAAATPATPASAGGQAAAAGAVLTGTVRLAPSVAALAKPDDVVFIFARPAEGARMPLAILRHQVKDLPVTFRLDDSMAMSPAMKLSQFAQVVVSARVSKSGQAVPAAGDLSGQSAPVGNQAQGLMIEINEVVKP